MIKIDSTSFVPQELRQRCDYKWHVERQNRFFNSDEFDEHKRTAITLHEGIHLFYARELGFEPKLTGPALEYSRKMDCFIPSVGSVQVLPKQIRLTADPVAVAKTFLAPLFVLNKLLNFDYSFVAEDNDIENFDKWCAERFPNEVSFRVGLWILAEDSVNEDLRKPAFRKKLWDAAREFEARVFGKPN